MTGKRQEQTPRRTHSGSSGSSGSTGGRTPKPSSSKAPVDMAKEAELKAAFECFDLDNSGTIDKDELAALMGNLGVALGDQDLGRLHAQMDTDGDGTISFEEFRETSNGWPPPNLPLSPSPRHFITTHHE